MLLDISVIERAANAMNQQVATVKTALNGEWYDSVHASFQNFIGDLNGIEERLNSLCNIVKAASSNVLDVDARKLQSALHGFMNNMPKGI